MADGRHLGIDLGASTIHVVVVNAPAGEGDEPARIVDARTFDATDIASVVALAAGAAEIAIDAPSELSTAPHRADATISRKFRVARCGEIALGQQRRIWVPWVTPADPAAVAPWMQVGFALWAALRGDGHAPVEVYPAGVFRVLGGAVPPRKTTRAGLRLRLDLLAPLVQLPDLVEMWSHDGVDALGAAVTARQKGAGTAQCIGHDEPGCDGSAIWAAGRALGLKGSATAAPSRRRLAREPPGRDMDVQRSGWIAFRRSQVTLLLGAVTIALLAGLALDIGRHTDVAGAVGAPPTRVITYEVRGLNNSSDLEQFAALAAQTYADPRGWSFGGSVSFVRVPSGGSFTLWLSAAGNVPGFGSPCSSLYSCRQGRNVVINETRWLTGSPAWNASGASLRDYRNMVINHETGHWIGFGHQLCGGPGQLAPVMQQQSISLQGCAPNPWPLDAERRAAAARLGVEIRLGFPFGALESVRPWLHAVRVTGWVIDPDTPGPTLVQVSVDGAQSAYAAALPRNDVAAAFPGTGPNHGFDVSVPATNGAHQVCASAVNVAGTGSNVQIGCQTVVVGSPFGTVESVRAGPREVEVSGWVIDPDTSASTTAHVYVDGVATVIPADGVRNDVAAGFPGSGANHGFHAVVHAPSGTHQVCVYGINIAAPGANSTLACRSITIGGSPFGAVDAATPGPHTVHVSGWVIDRDTAAAGTVHVYVDGTGYPVSAGNLRNDVRRTYPLYGSGHGFSADVPAPAGAHRVCVYGINTVGPGSNTTLACRLVVVGGSPFGAVDSVTGGAGVVQVRGWTIDPDTAGAGTVHVYVDAAATAIVAGTARPDIGVAFPPYGPDHGFDGAVPATPGGHRVCVYAINVSGPGSNTTLACRAVTVPAF